jgi:hypothetical protein
MPTKQNAQSAFSKGSLQLGVSGAHVHTSPTLCRSAPYEPTDIPADRPKKQCTKKFFFILFLANLQSTLQIEQ